MGWTEVVKWLTVGTCWLLLCGCGSCNPHSTPDDSGEDPDAIEIPDTSWDPDLPDEPDVPDIDVDPDPDVALDTTPVDPPLDDGTDPEFVDCHELDYGASDLGMLDMPSYDAVGRTPMDCGADCRQVTFTEGQLWNGAYDVWGNWLVMDTWFEPDMDHKYKRVIMVDLGTLDHYLLDERNYALEDRPTNGHVDLYQDRVTFQTKVNTPATDYDFSLYTYQDVDPAPSKAGSLVFEETYPFASGGMAAMDSWGTLVAWSDYRDSLPVIAVLDLDTREECLVSARGFGTGNPAVWDTKVAFHEGSLGWYNVFVYDSGTGAVTRVTGPTGDQFGADIWQDRVVWTDTRGAGTMLDQFNTDVYMMDLTTGVTTAICTDPAMQPAPVSIYGDRIVWVDCRHDLEHSTDCAYSDRTEIYMYDIASGTETRSPRSD